MRYKIKLQRTFTYYAEIDATDKQEITDNQEDIIQRILENGNNILDHALDSDWNLNEINEVEE